MKAVVFHGVGDTVHRAAYEMQVGAQGRVGPRASGVNDKGFDAQLGQLEHEAGVREQL